MWSHPGWKTEAWTCGLCHVAHWCVAGGSIQLLLVIFVYPFDLFIVSISLLIFTICTFIHLSLHLDHDWLSLFEFLFSFNYKLCIPAYLNVFCIYYCFIIAIFIVYCIVWICSVESGLHYLPLKGIEFCFRSHLN